MEKTFEEDSGPTTEVGARAVRVRVLSGNRSGCGRERADSAVRRSQEVVRADSKRRVPRRMGSMAFAVIVDIGTSFSVRSSSPILGSRDEQYATALSVGIPAAS
jgi:hypothetical protein